MRPLPIIVKGNSRDNNRNVSSNKMLNNSVSNSSGRRLLPIIAEDSNNRVLNNVSSKRQLHSDKSRKLSSNVSNSRNVSSNKVLSNSKNVSSNRQHNRKLNSNVRLLNNSVSKSSGVQLPLKTQGNNNANNLLLRRIPKVLINRRNRKRSVEGSEMIKLPENSKKYSLFSIN